MAAEQALHAFSEEYEKAKEKLKDLEDTINRIQPRDDSNTRFGQARFLGESGGPGAARFRGAPSPRPAIGMGGPPRRGRGTFNRLGGRLGPPTRDPASDEEPENKPSVQSSIVKNLNEKSRQDKLDAESKDKAGKERNKRMFGMLLGTLQQFKSDAQVNQQSEKSQQRRSVEQKLDEKAAVEKETLKKEREELIMQRKRQRDQILVIEKKMELADIYKKWETQTAKLLNFVRTKARPHIFYLPKQAEEIVPEQLKDTQAYVLGLIDKRKEKFQRDVDILTNSIEDTQDKSKPRRPSAPERQQRPSGKPSINLQEEFEAQKAGDAQAEEIEASNDKAARKRQHSGRDERPHRENREHRRDHENRRDNDRQDRRRSGDHRPNSDRRDRDKEEHHKGKESRPHENVELTKEVDDKDDENLDVMQLDDVMPSVTDENEKVAGDMIVADVEIANGDGGDEKQIVTEAIDESGDVNTNENTNVSNKVNGEVSGESDERSTEFVNLSIPGTNHMIPLPADYYYNQSDNIQSGSLPLSESTEDVPMHEEDAQAVGVLKAADEIKLTDDPVQFLVDISQNKLEIKHVDNGQMSSMSLKQQEVPISGVDVRIGDEKNSNAKQEKDSEGSYSSGSSYSSSSASSSTESSSSSSSSSSNSDSEPSSKKKRKEKRSSRKSRDKSEERESNRRKTSKEPSAKDSRKRRSRSRGSKSREPRRQTPTPRKSTHHDDKRDSRTKVDVKENRDEKLSKRHSTRDTRRNSPDKQKSRRNSSRK